MKIRVSGLVNESIVDGPGFRFSIFTQGCPHMCPGCHNPQTHPFDGGYEADTEAIIAKFSGNELLDGITLTGGEPFRQSTACKELAAAAKAIGLNVWAYSGYTFERLMEAEDARALLECVDVLVDGPFLLEERTLSARFRGSRNQRLIDVPASLAAGSAIPISEN